MAPPTTCASYHSNTFLFHFQVKKYISFLLHLWQQWSETCSKCFCTGVIYQPGCCCCRGLWEWVCNHTEQQSKLSLQFLLEGAELMFCSPCLSGFARCMTSEAAVYISWEAASRCLTRLHRAGRNGWLGGLLLLSPQLQNGEICHCRKQKNRNIVSALSAGGPGIHYWVRRTACPPRVSLME